MMPSMVLAESAVVEWAYENHASTTIMSLVTCAACFADRAISESATFETMQTCATGPPHTFENHRRLRSRKEAKPAGYGSCPAALGIQSVPSKYATHHHR
jgi:hypothetical protein